ncbi:MAG: hypothetical protein P4N60_02635 [Verrucomicrobiae bacterium]|nr:hypothetical protein [Verrucomicrobiae bacterium]
MIRLDDPIWDTFAGGYRVQYNASGRLQQLSNGSGDLKEIWEEFWNELHHQGDVDIASYASVPQLVHICVNRDLLDWNAFALVAIIEECRIFGENPKLPGWLEKDYHLAIKTMAEFGARRFAEDWSKQLTQSFLAVAAFSKGANKTARMLATFSDDELDEVYEKFFQ